MARTAGVEWLERLNDGRAEIAPSEFLIKTRDDVSAALEELIEVGARIRPLLVAGERVGWVRGVHLSERRELKRWITDELEFVRNLISIATTLTPDEISNLSLIELRSISRVIRAMSDSDLKLYAYVGPFVTTYRSEQLWFSRGKDVTSLRDHSVRLPDGKQIQIVVASDQARLWATLCNYRIQAKQRVEASMNAALMVRAMVGKGADALTNDLKSIAKSLQSDALDPWRDVVRFKEQPDLSDGWAHSGDDSVEGMLRELNGMIANDRHEQVFARLDEQMRNDAERKKQEIERRIEERGGPGFIESTMTPMTEEEVRQRSNLLRQRRPLLPPPPEEDDEPQSSPADRLAKYR